MPLGAPRFSSKNSLWGPPDFIQKLPPGAGRVSSKNLPLEAAELAGPTGQGRAKISGNWLTIFLVRARGAGPGGLRPRSVRQGPGQSPARSRPGPSRLPRALQERSKWPPRELNMVRDGPRAIQDAQEGLQTAQGAVKTPQEASNRPPKRALRSQNR